MLKSIQARLQNYLRRKILPTPIQARHNEYSMLFSEDDAVSRPSERLIELSLSAIERARKTDLTDICRRMNGQFPYPDHSLNTWPGEHYRLLAGFAQTLKPKLVIEIGTAEGLSALSMLKYMSEEGQLITFDIVRWEEYPRKCLVKGDFETGNVKQIVADLGEQSVFNQYRSLISRADMIFIDAAKDGILEKKFIVNFETVDFESDPIFIFDDIRLWNMLKIWRELRWSKLDLTSFGHWCGTGICEPPKPLLSQANVRK